MSKHSPIPGEGLEEDPRIRDEEADAAFAEQCRTMNLDPSNPWIGDYVNYEWRHLRPILNAYAIAINGKRVLEFGCNVGGSAVVLAQLGAQVEALDIDANVVELARRNARRYGVDPSGFTTVKDTRSLPFEAGRFDLVTCNSVLEYVPHAILPAVQRELDRVLKPGGLILITGTSSRLWPRETHSRNWFANYLPRFVDKLLPNGKSLTRGVSPWQIRNGFGSHYHNLDAADGGKAFLAAHAQMVPPKNGVVHHLAAGAARIAGCGPGLLMNNLSCLLRKEALTDRARDIGGPRAPDGTAQRDM